MHTHSIGRSTSRTTRICPRTEQHSGFDLRRTQTTLNSGRTCRAHIVSAGDQLGTIHIGPRTACQHSEFDLRRMRTTLGSDSTRRAHIIPVEAQSGTTNIGPRTAGQHSGFDLRQTHTTLGSDSTCRADIVPAGAQPGLHILAHVQQDSTAGSIYVEGIQT